MISLADAQHGQLDPSYVPDIEHLTLIVNGAHRQVGEALRSALNHAFIAGEALLAIQPQIKTGWREWVESNVDVHWSTANDYMRVAYFRAELEELGATYLAESLELLRGKRRPGAGPGRNGLPDVAAKAREMISDGKGDQEIADVLEVSKSTVFKWRNPEAAQTYSQRATAASAERTKQSPARDHSSRVNRYGAPSRVAVTKAVRALALASDRSSIVEALLDLEAISGAWARSFDA